MRFTFEGKTYVLEFQRDADVSVTGRQRRYTTARLLELVSTDQEVVPIRQGKVACYFRDKFSFEAGRKAALAKALYDAPTVGGGEPIIGTRLSKEFRRAIWKAYHSRSKS